MQHLLRKMKEKNSYKYHWKSSVAFFILELKCIKKDIYRSEIFIKFADFNLHTGYTIKRSQSLEYYRQENYKWTYHNHMIIVI